MAFTKKGEIIAEAKRRAAQLGLVLSLLLLFDQNRAGNIKYDRKRLRFLVGDKTVPIGQIRLQLKRMEAYLAGVIVLYIDKLLSGEWTVEKWRDEMEKILGTSHLLFAALAFGGVEAVLNNKEILAKVEQRYNRDVKFLGRFSKDIKRGKYSSAQRAINRAKSYIKSAYITYAAVELQAAKLAGYKEAKRILTAKESCHQVGARIGCIEAAAKGWVPIDDMAPIGTLVCGQFCLCYLIFR